MRATDPRGASRRGSDNADLGYTNIDGSGARPAAIPHQPKPPTPVIQPGVRMWRHPSGHVMARCDAHAPLGAKLVAPTSTSRCVTCAVMGAAQEVEV